MANLFPIEPVVEEQAIEAETGFFGRSWAFDFEAGEFALTPTGKVAETRDTDAWVQWCRKALQTERYRHVVYSRDYGQEFADLIGLGLTRSAMESEIARIATETLSVDPRTAAVGPFVFEWEGDVCRFECRIANRRDEETTIQGSVVNA